MKRAGHKEDKAASGMQRVKVAVVQAAPVVFNRKRTLEKVHALTRVPQLSVVLVEQHAA
jgi:hypothetical protein